MGDRIDQDISPCEDRAEEELTGDAQAAGSLYLTDLDVALRNFGIEVWEDPGWRQRGHGGLSGPPRGILIHHTAGGGPNDWKVVRNGRAGLAGPLAQMTFERPGAVRLIAAGQCWHSGNGSHPGVGGAVGNGRLIGIEGVSKGTGNDWTSAQRRLYPKVAAALCRHYRIPVSAVVGHKEYATPRGRKIDPGDWDMNQFRADVARELDAPSPPGRPVVRRGSTDTAVKVVQETLGIPVTDRFDQLTERTVRDYQRDNGLAVDGEVGPATWKRLERDMSKIDEIHTLVKETLGRAYYYQNHHGNSEDNQFGHVMSIRKELAAMRGQLDRIEAALPKAPTR